MPLHQSRPSPVPCAFNFGPWCKIFSTLFNSTQQWRFQHFQGHKETEINVITYTVTSRGVATGIITLIAKLAYKSLSNCLLQLFACNKQRCLIYKSNCTWIAVHCASSPQFGCTHLIPSIDVCSKFTQHCTSRHRNSFWWSTSCITALFIPRIGDVLMLTLSLHIFMNITC
jgi:hypothetical protein